MVRFHLLETFTLKDRNKLKAFINSIFKKEGKSLNSLDYIFCSDDYLLKINQDFLKHDYFTDIITFDLSNPGEAVTGEVYISIDRVKDNAAKNHTSFTNELHRVVFHGVLHLCGFKDKKPADKSLMTRREDYYLSRY